EMGMAIVRRVLRRPAGPMISGLVCLVRAILTAPIITGLVLPARPLVFNRKECVHSLGISELLSAFWNSLAGHSAVGNATAKLSISPSRLKGSSQASMEFPGCLNAVE